MCQQKINVNHVRLFFVFIEITSGASLVLGDFISPLCVLGWQPVGGNQLLILDSTWMAGCGMTEDRGG